MSIAIKAIGLGALGAAAGFAYYYFVGCNSGHCPLTSTWYVTTGYGAAMGALLGIPAKKKKQTEKDNEKLDK